MIETRRLKNVFQFFIFFQAILNKVFQKLKANLVCLQKYGEINSLKTEIIILI